MKLILDEYQYELGVEHADHFEYIVSNLSSTAPEIESLAAKVIGSDTLNKDSSRGWRCLHHSPAGIRLHGGLSTHQLDKRRGGTDVTLRF